MSTWVRVTKGDVRALALADRHYSRQSEGALQFLPCYLHVGRVNTKKRIRLCQEAGADSFDGSGVSRFSAHLPVLDSAVRQSHLDWSEDP